MYDMRIQKIIIVDLAPNAPSEKSIETWERVDEMKWMVHFLHRMDDGTENIHREQLEFVYQHNIDGQDTIGYRSSNSNSDEWRDMHNDQVFRLGDYDKRCHQAIEKEVARLLALDQPIHEIKVYVPFIR